MAHFQEKEVCAFLPVYITVRAIAFSMKGLSMPGQQFSLLATALMVLTVQVPCEEAEEIEESQG